MANPVTGFFTITDATPKIKGFGTPLIMCYHNHFPGVRKYTADTDGLAAMRADGFTLDENGYDLANTLCSQTPHTAEFKIGRLNTLNTETFTLTVNSATPGDKIGISGGAGAGSIVEIEYTVPASGTTSTCATAVGALITASSVMGWTVSVAGAVLTCTRQNVAKGLRLRGFTANLTFKDNTPAVGYAADLAAATTSDSDYYHLLVEGRSAAAVGAAQAFAEANGKFYVGLCADTDCTVSGNTTNALYVGSLSNLTRGPVISSRDRNGNQDVALVALVAAYAPGKITYANRSFSGPRVDNYTPAEIGVIEANHGICYVNFLGTPMTRFGWAPGGRFCDLTNLGDLVVARVLEGLGALMARELRVGYDARGRGLVDAECRAVLALQESEGKIIGAGLTDGWETSVPAREDLTVAERTQRKLPRIKLKFTAVGAVHEASFEVLIKL